ncbi:hypothetical protein COCC4DRAFT_123696 [Bipolaris maydis ATCC 48331]|uniref:Ecp2 effector protein domain-containing protein n=2 Tax=Cochliobolus heterostrophus TaxID=5016 RepID=M2V670_COCH5|nr:uncharacterized protein COCC4DRAFT_123696 [Bipolaris maydis ATCC 48331]EMD95487.1 hypothetical protein COCHEDRAFT_1089930 [Bipolaris maydis C5]ENI10350.1 hypothetical protein COCC4DRAFT_123696 [Bipolaris maydis ATCC 48331]KAJ6213697.1 hypothetical protein PSV09DRAFT_1089930 [Bipolaris maydis]
MTFLTTFFVPILLALTHHATAFPTETHELIPGSGLPSLASLNLTTSDIVNLPLPIIIPTGPRKDPQCGPEDAYTNVDSLITCYKYIHRLGTEFCEFRLHEVKTLCRIGGVGVVGIGIGKEVERSYCSDVALGLLTVIDGCTRPNQSAAGFAAANGNGNIIVGGTRVDYIIHI